MSYRRIDAAQVIATAVVLERRVAERFPDAGLRRVAGELVALANDLSQEAVKLERPVVWLRMLIALVCLVGLGVILFVGSLLSFDRISGGTIDIVQGIEAALNTVLLVSVGLFSLVKTEQGIKRRKVLGGLHALRSLIHVIDMHQLTKDPAALASPLTPTASSPKRTMSPSELARYLDYCSEMLSISGKVAALFAQSVNDDVVVGAVNDVEDLGSNLSRKIWQKIMLIEEGRMREGSTRPAKPKIAPGA